MLGERTTELFDRALDRLARGVRPQPLQHQVAHAVPVRIPDAPVDALVADDRETPLLDRQVDQHAVALGGAVHAEPVEHVPGSRERVRRAPEETPGHAALEVHADLARRARFGFRDRARDRIEVVLVEELPCPRGTSSHHQLPLAPPPPELPPPPEKPPPPPDHPPPPPLPQPPPYQTPGPDRPQPRRAAV